MIVSLSCLEMADLLLCRLRPTRRTHGAFSLCGHFCSEAVEMPGRHQMNAPTLRAPVYRTNGTCFLRLDKEKYSPGTSRAWVRCPNVLGECGSGVLLRRMPVQAGCSEGE